MKLEYLMLFEKSGLPIYSHCFGGFCANLGFEEGLLSGFLSALTTMPQIFGHGESVQSVDMSYTKLLFSHSENGVVMVIGIDRETFDEQSESKIRELFSALGTLVDIDYADVSWNLVREDIRYKFEHQLIDNILREKLDVYIDYCRAGDNCLFDVARPNDTEEILEEKVFWKRLAKRYEYAIEKLPILKKVMFKPLSKVYKWLDNRDFAKRQTAAHI